VLVRQSGNRCGIARLQSPPEANAASPQAPAEPNGPPPKIVFEQTVHDFGAVAPGSLNPCKFKFKNAGLGVLKISEVTKTCGCTVFTLEKKDYAPGEEGVIEVGYNADKASGPEPDICLCFQTIR